MAWAAPAIGIEQAVVEARGNPGCGTLHHNDTVEQAADIVNRSTYDYLSHRTGDVPADERNPTAILKDLGITTTQAISLQGAAKSEADAIKGALLQGYKAIPDCTYSEIGTSRLYEEQSGYVLVVIILVGR